jgi:hypothetical protein
MRFMQRTKPDLRALLLVSIVVALALAAASSGCLANDATTQKDETTQNGATKPDGLPDWPRTRFFASELQGLQLGDLQVEAHFCGCNDKPNKHFPYSLVLLKTSKGDLVARPERLEGAVTYTPLAVRRGNQYCELESETQCYGSFPDPCDFTDYRFGQYLAPFFPTCKAE